MPWIRCTTPINISNDQITICFPETKPTFVAVLYRGIRSTDKFMLSNSSLWAEFCPPRHQPAGRRVKSYVCHVDWLSRSMSVKLIGSLGHQIQKLWLFEESDMIQFIYELRMKNEMGKTWDVYAMYLSFCYFDIMWQVIRVGKVGLKFNDVSYVCERYNLTGKFVVFQ